MRPLSLDVLAYAAELRRQHPEWREGQSVFNAAHRLAPRAADSLRGGPLDPFHRNALVDAFCRALDDFTAGPAASSERSDG